MAAGTLSCRLHYRLRKIERTGAWLGRRCGVHAATANGWVSGRHTPPLWRIEQISRELRVPVSWLIGDQPLDSVPDPF